MERIIWLVSLVAALWAARRRKVVAGLVSYCCFNLGFGLAAMAGGFEVALAPLFLAVNAVVAAAALVWLVALYSQGRPKLVAVLLLAVALAAVWTGLPLAEEVLGQWDLAWFREGKLSVHFIDVGQGDAILLEIPGGAAVLIDGGSRGAGERVAAYLRGRGIQSLDLVVATHPHEDHIGGLLTVLAEFDVGEVWDPGVVHTTQTFEQYLEIIDRRGIEFTEARVGLSKVLGGVRLEVLHPGQPLLSGLNNVSVVVRATYGTVSFLFTGDAEVEVEHQMLQRQSTLNAAVLKIGHHGSATSTSAEFLTAVNPSIGVITVGADNRYSHPHQQTLDLLQAKGVDTYRTDLHGTVVISTTGNGVQVRTQRRADPARVFRAP